MKQLRSLLPTLLLICLCCPAALAADFADGHTLYQHWMSNETDPFQSPYPDYVCGVWTEDDGKTLTIALTRDPSGERGQWEIQDMVEDSDSIKFHSQRYSYQELLDVQQALLPRMGESGLSGTGIHQMDNQVVLTIDMDHPDSEAFMKECFEQYRDRIRFEDGTFSVTAEEMGVGMSKGNRLWVEVEESPLTYTLAAILLILMLVTARVMQGPSTKKHIMDDTPESKSHVRTGKPEKKKRP